MILHPMSGLNDLFLGPKYRKISLEKYPLFAYFFEFYPLVLCSTAMDSVGHPGGENC